MRTYDRYQRLSRALTERYRVRIHAADSRVGLDGAFHLTHNWGNDAARSLLALYNKRSSQLNARQSREYKREEKR
jgi:hypothetical protein